jgi:DNA-binding winged helix-turn-helix (wHTH) protein/tetratricopeptide (TPR) repeat protein
MTSPDVSLTFGPFRLDPVNRQLLRGGEPCAIRPKTFAVLWYLANHPKRLVKQDELLQAVWEGAQVSEGLLRSYVRELRQALGDDAGSPEFIETIAGRGYRFLLEVRREQPLDLQDRIGCAGRGAELELLLESFDRALGGKRQIVFISGEPGIGKTTLLNAFLRRVEAQGPLAVARGYCVEQYGPAEPYLPLLQAVGGLCRSAFGGKALELVRRHAPTLLMQMPSLIAEAEAEALYRRTQGATQARILRELSEAFEILSNEQPIVLAIEDLHWSDPSTAALLSLMCGRKESARLLVLGTYRRSEVLRPTHPLSRVVEDARLHGDCTHLVLSAFAEDQVAEYLARRFSRHDFSSAFARLLHGASGGNPLFVAAVADELVERGFLRERDDVWRLSVPLEELAGYRPSSLSDLIELQLARLTIPEQRVVEAGAVAGVEFATGAVAAALHIDAADAEEHCAALARREHFLVACAPAEWSDGTFQPHYALVHALHRDAAIHRVPVARRREWHLRIAERLESGYRSQADEIASELATHYAEGQEFARAMHYYAVAGERAVKHYALKEAADLYHRGLAIAARAGDSMENRSLELRLLVGLGPCLTASEGYVSQRVETVYERAFELTKQIGPTDGLMPTLYGMFLYRLARAEFEQALDLATTFRRIAERNGDPGTLAQALGAVGTAELHLGRLHSARQLMEEAIASYDPTRDRALALQSSNDPCVSATMQLGMVLWHLGYPDQAVSTAERAVEIARASGIPFLLTMALAYLARPHRLRREPFEVERVTTAAIDLADQHGFPFWRGEARVFHGWALVAQGKTDAGLAHLEEGMQERIMAGPFGRTTMAMVAGDAYRIAGQIPRGLEIVEGALEFVETTGELAWRTELHRVRGELLLASRPSDAEGIQCLERALELARWNGARSFELRALVSLNKAQRTKARLHELSTVYATFTEGHESGDLADAAELLRQ